MNSLFQDIRYGARMLAKNPSLVGIAVVTLALGIGSNTAVFSMVNGTLLRPLGFPDAEQLVQFRMRGFTTSSVSVPNFMDWREQCESFRHMGIYRRSGCNFSGYDSPERLNAVVASASVLQVLGFDVFMGRAFGQEAETSGRNRVVLLSEGFWKRKFGSDPGIVEDTILLNEAPFTVLGILPGELESAWGRFDVWIPFVLDGIEYERGNFSYQAVGRVKAGVGIGKARAELTTVSARVARQHPQGNMTDAGTPRTAELVRFIDARVGKHGKSLLLMLSVAVALVLLIGCVNVANLVSAQSSARQREFAVRAALGAGRWRLIRQVVTECTLLALAGGVIGVLLASWSVDLLQSAFPNQLSQAHEMASDQTPRTSYNVGIDQRVLIITLGLSFMTSLLFGLAPAFRNTRVNLSKTLKEGAGSLSLSASRVRIGDCALVGQIALTLVLVTCAGLLMKSFKTLTTVSPGFEYEQILTMRLSLDSKNHTHAEKRNVFLEEVTGHLREMPGVLASGATHALPLCSRGTGNTTTIEEYAAATHEKFYTRKVVTTPGYFDTMGIALLSGRDFTETDTADGLQVVIVSQNIAERFWPGESALGKRLKYGLRDGPHPWLTVIGMVSDVKQYGLDQETPFETYRPYSQELWWTAGTPMTIVARTVGDPLAATKAVQEAIWEVDPDIPVYEVSSMDSIVADSTSDHGAIAGLLIVFAAIALLLAVIGLYGVMAHSISRRTRELGLRIALGAQAHDLLRLVMARSTLLALLGILGGVCVAFGLAHMMEALLFNVSPTDPMIFISTGLGVMAVVLLACFLPARRATKVDPMVALRCE